MNEAPDATINLFKTSIHKWSNKDEVQSPLVIVDLLIVDSLVIVDRLSRPIVHFSMCISRNSGFFCYSGHFATDIRIHYYKRRLYIAFKIFKKLRKIVHKQKCL